MSLTSSIEPTNLRKILLAFILLFLLILIAVLQTKPNTYKLKKSSSDECWKRNKKTRSWPRIIHQTWKDNDVPERYRSMQESCRIANPEYEYRLWTDADLEQLIREHYNWFLETWQNYPYPIQRIDAARLFIIHRHGGVYLDLDIHCNIKLSELKDDALLAAGHGSDVILAETEPLGVTNNFIMAQSKTPFMEFITRRLLETNGKYLSPHWTVMFTAGPIFVYKTYLKYPCKHEVHLISQQQHSKKYFSHLQARSWHSWDGPIITFFDYNGRTLMKLTVVVIILLLVLFYWKAIVNTFRGIFKSRKSTMSKGGGNSEQEMSPIIIMKIPKTKYNI